MRFDGGLTAPGDRVLFMLSVARSLTNIKGEKRVTSTVLCG